MTVRTAADRARRLERQELVATRQANDDSEDTWLADMERKLAAGADSAPER